MTMQLNLLKVGNFVKTRRMISAAQASHWKHAATNAALLGGLMPGTAVRVAKVSTMPPSVQLELPGRSPPALITLTGEELAGNFEMGALSSSAPKAAPNHAALFQRMAQRQMAVGAGLDALRTARAELKKDIATGQLWGNAAVFANAMLLPLNVIVNAFQLKGATTVYQALVKEAYAKFSKSGSRIDNNMVKTSLSVIKKAATEALGSQGLKKLVPGVNILIGVAEDGFALFETARTVQEGSNEMRALLRNFDAKVERAYQDYIAIGIEMDRLLTEMQRRARTA